MKLGKSTDTSAYSSLWKGFGHHYGLNVTCQSCICDSTFKSVALAPRFCSAFRSKEKSGTVLNLSMPCDGNGKVV